MPYLFFCLPPFALEVGYFRSELEPYPMSCIVANK